MYESRIFIGDIVIKQDEFNYRDAYFRALPDAGGNTVSERNVSSWKKKMPQVCDFRLATAQPVVRAASLGRASGVIRRGEHTVARFPSRGIHKKTLAAG